MLPILGIIVLKNYKRKISEIIERSIEKQIEREMFEYRFQIEPLASEKGMYIKELPEGCTSLYTEKIEEIYE